MKFPQLFTAVCLLCPALLNAQTVVVDNLDAGFSTTGDWKIGTSTPGYIGSNYRFADAVVSASPTAVATFVPTLPTIGYYRVFVHYNSGGNRVLDARYTVAGDLVTSNITVNQQVNGGSYFYLGQMHFQPGASGYITVDNRTINSGVSVVMADAVKLEYVGLEPEPEPPVEPPPTGGDITGPEVRGLWVSRFEWPGSSQSATQFKLSTIINNADLANMNSIYLQIRGQMDVHFPSPDEPWAAHYGASNPGYDPVAFAVDAAHSKNMELHAYINTHAIYQGTGSPPNSSPPHPYYAHGNFADPNARDWLFHTVNGPQAYGEENYVWVAPAVPSFQSWTRKQVMYIASNYNVDGVHFDRIRFAGDGSYDPITDARLASPVTNPTGLSRRNFQRDQITRLLNDIYGAVAELNYNRNPATKRRIKVSTAPFSFASAQLGVNQDVGAWSAIGGQDYHVPQVYTGTLSTFRDRLNTNFPLAFGRHVVAGIGRNFTGSLSATVDQIREARARGAQGNVIFSYTAINNATNEWNGLKGTAYGNKVATPAMPWLDNPTDAIIVGTVTGNGEPIEDAYLSRGNGGTYRWFTTTDGFFSMLKVQANTATTITVNKDGFDPVMVNIPALAPGTVHRQNILIGDPPATSVDWELFE